MNQVCFIPLQENQSSSATSTLPQGLCVLVEVYPPSARGQGLALIPSLPLARGTRLGSDTKSVASQA
ncbi:hypothetical protein JCGZ_09802 [Jatropha curcas]|uniref:Uncharacterized protein n=1 Tax=Jatropha curcas TaxID=180498 RepID=A0A067KVL2_JATCU|nr:hypothetical protein JCGZ_09802 [Jatropha curcas]